jgi:hypothetical protein
MNWLKFNFLVFLVIFTFPFDLVSGTDLSWNYNEGGRFAGNKGHFSYSDTLVPTVYLVSVNDTVSPQSSCGFNVSSERSTYEPLWMMNTIELITETTPPCPAL